MEDDDGRVVTNQYSFCELVKHLLVHYVGISYANVSEMVDNFPLAKPILCAMEAGLLGYELPYYWDMNLYYGNMYWEKGISVGPDILAAYFELENSIIIQYNLKDHFE